MALSLPFGQIEWSHLIFYFQPGEEYLTYDPDDPSKQIAFILTSRSYQEGISGKPYLALNGTAYEWDGLQYSTYCIRRRLEQYKGSVDLDALDCTALTAGERHELLGRCALNISRNPRPLQREGRHMFP